MAHVIRTRNEPGREIEVGDAEFLDLTRMGLVLDAESDPAPKDQDVNPAPLKRTHNNQQES